MTDATKLIGDLQDYREAMVGEGPLVREWDDSPHHLVYDLCNEIERLRSVDYTAAMGPLARTRIERTPDYNDLKVRYHYLVKFVASQAMNGCLWVNVGVNENPCHGNAPGRGLTRSTCSYCHARILLHQLGLT